ncbi:MFS transporter [Catenulispora sp. NF23]|uniref:MFS transporter n=1 Tax=Catenulispora pinistramenti TaxID=2705254 RepID=UPI001BA9A770|nr:MFS transporter [Catenulispora pinistramenti]MBS2539273.1 MFS transporter [Catenulispora pinistramenti]
MRRQKNTEGIEGAYIEGAYKDTAQDTKPPESRPLRHRDFRLLAGGQLASSLGDAFYAVALPWYVLVGHGGSLMLSTVLFAYGVPRTALLLVGGQASDRWRPWTVMLGADAVRAVAVAGLAVTAALGPVQLWILVPIAAAIGAGEGIFLPGSFAIVPALLPDAGLQAGNALLSGGTQAAALVGPALGGLLVAAVGASSVFAFDAFTFAVSALTLLGVRGARRGMAGVSAAAAAQAQPAPALAESAPGAKPPKLTVLLRTSPVLLVVLLITVAANLGSGGLSQVALAALARGPLHTDAAGYGVLIAAIAAGSLLGTVAAGRTRRVRRPAMLGSGAFLLAAVCLAVAPWLGGVGWDGAALAGFGLGNGFGNIVMITLFQRWAPPQLLGRLTGLLMLASFGVFPLSALFAGSVVGAFGPAAYFPLAAGMLAGAIGIGMALRQWREFGAEGPPAAADPARLEVASTAAAPV